MLNALLIVTGVLVVIGMVLARPLVSAYAGDFAAVPGKLELTIHLTRVMLPFLTLVAIAAAMMGMLNSLHHYFVPALAPATFNVATIVVRGGAGAAHAARSACRAIISIAIGRWSGGVAQVAGAVAARFVARDSATGRCSTGATRSCAGSCC